MPFANNQGARIRYETVGRGRALVLHHGLLGSGADWADFGYVDALKEDHQLILLDARGHGESDKPHDPAAYDVTQRTLDVLAVLDDLSIRKADYFGYSLGGFTGFWLAKYAPHRFNSFIICGAHPYAENMQPTRDFVARNADAFATKLDQIYGSRLTPVWRSRILANDFDALRAMIQDRVSNADVLPTMTMPCLLFVGELDARLAAAKKCASELPNVTFFTLPECDHIDTLVRSDLVIPHIRAFLSKVGR
jgi:pimeloyl-ACP methyl ester carboxylesterase